jgi:hypothetical protein
MTYETEKETKIVGFFNLNRNPMLDSNCMNNYLLYLTIKFLSLIKKIKNVYFFKF